MYPPEFNQEFGDADRQGKENETRGKLELRKASYHFMAITTHYKHCTYRRCYALDTHSSQYNAHGPNHIVA